MYLRLKVCLLLCLSVVCLLTWRPLTNNIYYYVFEGGVEVWVCNLLLPSWPHENIRWSKVYFNAIKLTRISGDEMLIWCDASVLIILPSWIAQHKHFHSYTHSWVKTKGKEDHKNFGYKKWHTGNDGELATTLPPYLWRRLSVSWEWIG